jgi:hypothetical protein
MIVYLCAKKTTMLIVKTDIPRTNIYSSTPSHLIPDIKNIVIENDSSWSRPKRTQQKTPRIARRAM